MRDDDITNSIDWMLKELTEKLQSFFPYPKRTSLEDWDFIFVFEEYYKGEVELMFSSLKCQSEIAWTVVDNPMEKQALFLLRLSDQVMKEMAHDLKILKIKNKRSYEIKLKEINLLSYLTDK